MAIKVEFIGVTKSIETAGKRVVGVLGDIAKTASGFALGQGFTKGIQVLGGLTTTSRQLELQMQKANIVFGDQIGVVKEWAAGNAAAMGLSRNQAVSLAAGLQDLLVPLGFTREAAAKMATETMNLAGALAEWTGGEKDAAEVAGILQAAFLGETDSLQGLGIALSAADVAARLAWKGQDKLTGAALKQAEAIAIQELILERSTDAQRKYAEGANTGARKTAEQAAKIQELKEKFALGLTPVIQQVQAVVLPLLTAALTKVGDVFDKNQPRIVAFTEKLRQNTPAAVVVVNNALANFLGMVNTVIRGVSGGFTTITTIVAESMSAIASIVSTVGQAIYTALQWLNPFAPHSPPLVNQVRDGVAIIKDEFASLNQVKGDLEGVAEGVRWFEAAMKGTANTLESADLEGKLDAIRRTGGQEAVTAFRATTAAIDAMRTSYDRLGSELADNTRKLEAESKALDVEKEKLEDLTDQVNEAKKRFDEFRGTPILEEQQYDKALKELERQMTEIELAITKIKQKGPLEFTDAEGKTHLTAAGMEVERLEKQLDALGLKADEVRLEEKLKIDPMKDQLDALDDAAPKPFNTIYDGARKAQAELDKLTAEQAAQTKKVEDAQAVYDTNAAAVESQRKAYEELGQQLADQTAMLDKYVDLAEKAVQQEEARAKAAEAVAKAEEAKNKAMDGAPPPVPPESIDIAGQLAEAGDKVKLSWAEAKTSFAEVKTELKEIRDQLAPIGQFFKDMSKHTGAIKDVAIAVGIFYGTLTLLNTAMAVTRGIIALTTVQQVGLNAAMAANPMGIIITTVALLAAGIYLLIKNWDTITEKVPILGVAVDKVREGFGHFMEFITGPVFRTLKKLDDEFGLVFTLLTLPIVTFFKAAKIYFETGFDVLMGIITFFRGLFTGDTEKMKEGVLKIFGALWKGAKEMFDLGVETLLTVGPKLLSAGEDLGGALLEGMKKALSSTAGFAGNVGEAVLKAVKGVINNYVIDPLNGALRFDFDTHIPGVGKITIDAPDIPRLASGGVVTSPTLALIGEAGPEAVIPLGKSGGIGDVHHHYWTVNAATSDPAGLARELAPHIERVTQLRQQRSMA